LNRVPKKTTEADVLNWKPTTEYPFSSDARKISMGFAQRSIKKCVVSNKVLWDDFSEDDK